MLEDNASEMKCQYLQCRFPQSVACQMAMSMNLAMVAMVVLAFVLVQRRARVVQLACPLDVSVVQAFVCVACPGRSQRLLR